MFTTPVTDRACRVVISQPMYFPWPGFIEQMALADVYVWLDDVQFSKGSFTNRVQVKTPSGERWMTIPLAGKGTLTNICDLQASDDNWRQAHKSLLRQSFQGSIHADKALAIFDEATSSAQIADCLISSCEIVAASLEVRPKKIVRSSELGVEGSSWKRVLDIVTSLGGTEYITGHGAANYLDHASFEEGGVSVSYMNYSLNPWPQQHGLFTPYVTALDLVAAMGDRGSSFLKPQKDPWREFLASKGVSG